VFVSAHSWLITIWNCTTGKQTKMQSSHRLTSQIPGHSSSYQNQPQILIQHSDILIIVQVFCGAPIHPHSFVCLITMRSPLFCFFLLLCYVAQYAHSFQCVIDGVCSMSGSARSSLSIAQLKKAGADRSRGTIIFATPSFFVQQERRPFLQNVAQTLLISSSFFSSSTVDVVNAIDVDQPKVTHKVFMDVRISRADGSFYVRDDPNPSSTSSEPFYGTLVFGLFGDRTPIHVKRFLDYVDVPYDVDSPLPSYSRSKFNTLDASTGLLIGGTIPGLDATTLAGGTVLNYSGRVLPAKLWLENNDDTQPLSPLSHNRHGLLTHRNLDLTPSFGITTRSSSNCDSTCMSLDATHTIFGCVL